MVFLQAAFGVLRYPKEMVWEHSIFCIAVGSMVFRPCSLDEQDVAE